MAHRARLLAFLAGLAPSACGSDPASPDAGPVDNGKRVVLGTGEAEFAPIEGEPRLRLVAGVQGGFHVWASFLTYGFSGERVDMLLETRVEDDPDASIVMRARLDLRDTTDANGEPARSFAGFPAQVYDARCAQDKRVRVEVTLSDADGMSSSDTRHCIADVPEQDRLSDCP
jgi:hypothetical protein